MRIGVKIKGRESPLDICTSSGTVGHSLSFGKADAVVILSPSAALADEVATAAANLVQKEEDLAKAVNFALGIPGVTIFSSIGLPLLLVLQFIVVQYIEYLEKNIIFWTVAKIWP